MSTAVATNSGAQPVGHGLLLREVLGAVETGTHCYEVDADDRLEMANEGMWGLPENKGRKDNVRKDKQREISTVVADAGRGAS